MEIRSKIKAVGTVFSENTVMNIILTLYNGAMN